VTSDPLCFNELTFGSPFEFVGLATVLVSSENNGFKGLCNVTLCVTSSFRGLVQSSWFTACHHMKHTAAFGYLIRLPTFSSVSVFRMENFAVVLCNSITLLQFLDPRALWCLQARVNVKGVEKFSF